MPKYKLYIFPQMHCVSHETRKRLRKALSKTGATALWIYAPGARQIRLLHRADVYDTVENRWIAENTDTFTIELRPRSTQLYYYGTRKEWEFCSKESKTKQ